MRRIAVINQKGGVGKTTTTANLGAAIARQGHDVLLIDLDPQGHLSLHYGCEVGEGQPSAYDVLVDSTHLRDVVRSVREHATLIPADIDLAGAEAELMGVVGREVILREAVNAFDQKNDFILIDCPPSLGILTVNALVTATEVIIPLQAHFFALQGMGKLLETITLVRQRINPQLRVSGIVLCMHDAATKLATEIVDDLTGFLEQARGSGSAWADTVLYQTRIRRNIKLAEAASFGKTVFDYDPKSHGAFDYESLAKEVLSQSASKTQKDPARKPARPIRLRKDKAAPHDLPSQNGQTPQAVSTPLESPPINVDNDFKPTMPATAV